MEWQIVVLVLQILLLAIGYFLFQQARAELNARAAETPVLGEVKALQRTVKQLLADIEETADQTSARLESRCAEARQLLMRLEARLDETAPGEERGTAVRASEVAPRAAPSAWTPQPAEITTEEPAIGQGIAVAATNYSVESGNATAPSPRETRRQTVYDLADAGETPAAIARTTGLSEGEVETLLGLRLQHR